VLSERTVRNLSEAFFRAVSATLVRQAGDQCTIAPANAAWTESQAGGGILLMTISSFTFRLITVFQVADGQPTRDYYVAAASAKTLDETFSEFANMCCGALGRELYSQFRHIGMSIPYVLEWQCARHLQELKPRMLASYDITIQAAVRVRATIAMCCEHPLEFDPPVIEATQAGGELELL
jgi:hypothetical protein